MAFHALRNILLISFGVFLLAMYTNANGVQGCGVRKLSEALSEIESDINHRTDAPSNESFEESLRDFAAPVSVLPRAVGGITARFKWPWMVAIFERHRQLHLCGGTLIDKRHVLTAAHCFVGRSIHPKRYSVQVGELLLRDRSPYYEVQEIKIHENYKDRYDYDDIAIMRLAKPLPSHVMPACLPNVDEIKEGEDLALLGWGRLSYRGPIATKLQEVHGLPVISNTKCNDVFQKLAKFRFPRGIWNKFLCAGGKEGKDACQGDSGGPLLQLNSENIWTLVGIVSFGIGCGKPGIPGVYTKVSSYHCWISEYVGNVNDVSNQKRKKNKFF